MMRYLRFCFWPALGPGLLTVALANRAPVTVKALPEDLAALHRPWSWQMELPLFVVIFGGIMSSAC
jgi:putative membrane protein